MNKRELFISEFQRLKKEKFEPNLKRLGIRLAFRHFFNSLPLYLLPELRRQHNLDSKILRKESMLNLYCNMAVYKDELYKFLLENDR